MVVDNLEEAMTLVEEFKEKQIPKSIGLIGNAADVFSELAARGVDHRRARGRRSA
jgi:urocanate hydratase